jgi:tRNA U34 2-thiouridine synthase MnmA/TrmU
MTAERPKAVALYSGGLDSRLAVEVLLRAGVEVVVLRHHSVFFPPKQDPGYDPPCETVRADVSEQMVALVNDPEYGHGKNANPCLDCKQMMYGRAWDEARARGAQFIATGEVLGQRPMSQHKSAFARMEKGAGVQGRVVRPLCGKLLPPTIPEREGLIEREDLLDIHGRSRKRQMELAAEWGIEGYPSPAGGCKLTDPQFAERVLTLRQMGMLTVENARAARSGRFFPLGDASFALVGRNEEDNAELLADAPEGALVLELREEPGPLACVVGEADEAQLDQARRLVVRYSRFKDLPPDAVGAWPPAEARARQAG